MASHIRFIMLNTSHSGNIGAAARAMKTMGLNQLVLVNPKDYPSAEATARASGADDLLHTAAIYTEFTQAIEDCQLVLGLSARLRRVKWPVLDVRQAAELAMSQANNAAFVFGQERTGLSNTEMDRCHYLVHIPSNPDFSSLNVASAIQIMAYELNMAEKAKKTEDIQKGEETASAAQMEGFYEHLEQTLKDIGFIEEHQAKLMRRLRRLFNRSLLNTTELNLLRGILRAAQGKSI